MPKNSNAKQLSTSPDSAALGSSPAPRPFPDAPVFGTNAALGGTTSDLPPTLAPVAQPGEAADAHDPAGRRRRTLLWLAGAAAAVLLAAGVGGAAYAHHYSGVALPGTSISGSDVAGLSRQEIVELVGSRAEAVKIKVSGDVSGDATLADLGTQVDAEATADAALAPNHSVLNRFKALFGSQAIAVVATNDADQAASYAQSLIPADAVVAKNASVALAADGQGFTVQPGTTGMSLDPAELNAAAQQAATTLTSSEVVMTFTQKDPEITDADAQAAVDEANARIASEVTLSTADGEDTFTADTATKASWVKVQPGEDGRLSVDVDGAAVTSWVNEQAEEVNTEPVHGKRNLSPSGTVLAISVHAVDGQTVSNTEALSQAIVQALSSKQPYSGTFEVTAEKATWQDRTVDPGAEHLAYQAAPGEKWVEVNLSTKTVMAYEGAKVVRGPEAMVDGAPETPTVAGTYNVYLKYEKQTMRGLNADGTTYETPDVPWVTYWHGSYALHGAPWRSSFGYSGSHGCVNMPVSTAKWYYDWTDIGTVVVSHW
ncbi:L,D-transpeptidase [Actinomyces weissii]|uniref:L,D-transpeptidase n=1 Tax=Actinomyces weissii TaxID=675090 RepID=UPI001F2E34FC|nr:L,D-transpeptidase [Actinomyces weissii]